MNAPFTVSFGGHLDPEERRTLATTPIYDYDREEWSEGHDHAHYAEEDCTSPMLLCRVPANLCDEFIAEWGPFAADAAADDLAEFQESARELSALGRAGRDHPEELVALLTGLSA